MDVNMDPEGEDEDKNSETPTADTIHGETPGGSVDPSPTPQELSVSDPTGPIDEPEDMANTESLPP